MPLDTRFGTLAIDAETNAVCAQLNDGYLRMYTGTRPETADDDPPIDAELLVELRFGAVAFQPSVNGVALANQIANGIAVNTGEATWYRTLTTTEVAVYDDTVGTVDESIVLSDGVIQMGALVALTAYQYTSPRAAA